MKNTFIFMIVFLCCAAVLSSCAHIKKLPEVELAPAEILNSLYRSGYPESVRATARLSVEKDDERLNSRLAIVAERPSSLRIESIPVMGTPDFILAANESRMNIYIPRQRKFYISPADKRHLAGFLPFSLELRDLVSILMAFPLIPDEGDLHLDGYPEDDLYRIDVFSGDELVQSLWVDISPVELRRMRVESDDGKEIFEVSYDDFKDSGDKRFPRTIKILRSQPDGEIRMELRYSDLELSFKKEGDESLFTLSPPPGIEPVTVR